jgi:sec-independent protein translocase protein TatB
MFEIGFTELLLVGIVALIVLGPDRLPGAVRTAGLWIGRIKRSFSAIKAEVEREIGADEIRRQLHNEQILELEREMNAMKQSINAPLGSLTETPSTATPAAEPAAPASTSTSTSTSQDKSPLP